MDTEVFAYDNPGRLEGAKTHVDEAAVRTSLTVVRSLSYGYDLLANLTSKPGASLAYAGTGNAGDECRDRREPRGRNAHLVRHQRGTSCCGRGAWTAHN